MLRDCLPKATEVEQTLGVSVCKYLISVNFIFAQLGFSTILNLFVLPFNPIIHTSRQLIVTESKVREIKTLAITRPWGEGLHNQKPGKIVNAT